MEKNIDQGLSARAGGTWESNSLCHFSSLGLNIWPGQGGAVGGLTISLPFKLLDVVMSLYAVA